MGTSFADKCNGARFTLMNQFENCRRFIWFREVYLDKLFHSFSLCFQRTSHLRSRKRILELRQNHPKVNRLFSLVDRPFVADSFSNDNFPAIKKFQQSASLVLVVLVANLLMATGCTSLTRNVETQREIQSRELTNGGIHAQQRGNAARAEHLFAKAIEACPSDERAHQMLAESLSKRGEKRAAILHMQKAVELSRNEPEMVVQLGRLIANTGDWQQAESFADQAISSDRKNVKAWILKAEACEMQSRPNRALTNYLNALSLDEENDSVRFSVARIYHAIGKPQRALSNLALISKSYPPDRKPESLVLLESQALMKMNCVSEAATRLASVMDREHPSAKGFLVYSQLLKQLGDSTNSRMILQRAVDLYPQNRELVERLAMANNDGAAVTVAKIEGR